MDFVLLLAAAVSVGAFQPAPVIGPSDAIGFDYGNADFVGYQVTRFENQYDGGPWLSIMVPPIALAGETVTTYRVIPTTVSGTHTIVFRACNAVGCSEGSAPFAFAVLGAPGTWPGNVRVIPR